MGGDDTSDVSASEMPLPTTEVRVKKQRGRLARLTRAPQKVRRKNMVADNCTQRVPEG